MLVFGQQYSILESAMAINAMVSIYFARLTRISDELPRSSAKIDVNCSLIVHTICDQPSQQEQHYGSAAKATKYTVLRMDTRDTDSTAHVAG
jgi:hypothetical protein